MSSLDAIVIPKYLGIIVKSSQILIFSHSLVIRCCIWNAKLTETRIFRELSIEIESSLIQLKSSLIQLKSSLIQLESSVIKLESSLIQLLSSLYIYNKRAH